MAVNDIEIKVDQESIKKYIAEAMDSYYDGLPTKAIEFATFKFRRALVQEALKQTRGNQTKAAAILNMNRGSLRQYL